MVYAFDHCARDEQSVVSDYGQDQFSMQFNRLINITTSFPSVFTNSCLNPELTLNGLITNDKFCMSRYLTLPYSQPWRWASSLPASKTSSILSPLNENFHCGATHETEVESTSNILSTKRRSATLGSSIPTPSAMANHRRVKNQDANHSPRQPESGGKR